MSADWCYEREVHGHPCDGLQKALDAGDEMAAAIEYLISETERMYEQKYGPAAGMMEKVQPRFPAAVKAWREATS